jgi:hypothetical protein
MKEQLHHMKEALVDPDEIRESMHTPSIWMFYKLYPHSPVSEKYLLVIVKVSDGEGFIVTAFFTDKLKKGGLLWKKNR